MDSLRQQVAAVREVQEILPVLARMAIAVRVRHVLPQVHTAPKASVANEVENTDTVTATAPPQPPWAKKKSRRGPDTLSERSLLIGCLAACVSRPI